MKHKSKYPPGRYAYGPRVRAVRFTLGLTQTELGDRVGLCGGMISLIEKGVHRTRHIVEIAVALDVDPRWLALGLGRPPLLSPVAELQRRNVRTGRPKQSEEPVRRATAAEEARRIWAMTPRTEARPRHARDWWRSKLPMRKRA